MKTFEIGDIVTHAIRLRQNYNYRVYGIVTGIRDSQSYFIDWFIEDSNTHALMRYMYRNEIEKVSA